MRRFTFARRILALLATIALVASAQPRALAQEAHAEDADGRQAAATAEAQDPGMADDTPPAMTGTPADNPDGTETGVGDDLGSGAAPGGEDAPGDTGGRPDAGSAQAQDAGEDEAGEPPAQPPLLPQADALITYEAHVQNVGWQEPVSDGALAGTSGRSLRVEGIRIRLAGVQGSVRYRAHVENVGWQEWVADGELAGTSGRSLRVEAFQIELGAGLSDTYDVWYRVHAQNVGWQGWRKNGSVAGTTGRGLRLEGIEIMLVGKSGPVPVGSDAVRAASASDPAVRYQAHVQNVGWQEERSDGATAGTSGRSLRVEGLKIRLTGYDGGIAYQAHVQNIGWQEWVADGELAGTSGQRLRVEAIRMRLTGSVAATHDVWYRTHVQNLGWTTWARGGDDAQASGSMSFGYRIEGIQVTLTAKGAPAPSMSPDPAVGFSYLSIPTVGYQAQVQGNGWQEERGPGVSAGTSGQSRALVGARMRISSSTVGAGIRYRASIGGIWQDWTSDGDACGNGEAPVVALQAELTGDAARYCDLWYRAYVSNAGWLDWTRNGGSAGSDGTYKRVEAFEVRVTKRNAAAPGGTDRAYVVGTVLDGVDISSWNHGIDVASLQADFVIVKATEGTDYVNHNKYGGAPYATYYRIWADQALSSGKLLGFYHYADGGNAIDEANHFYNTIKDYKGRAVVCLDWEGEGNAKFGTGEDVAWCKTFLDRIAALMDCTPLLYVSRSVTTSHDWASVARAYPLWVAQYLYRYYDETSGISGYVDNPTMGDSTACGAWGSPLVYQYTSTGHLPGFGGFLDFDKFYGSRDAWMALA